MGSEEDLSVKKDDKRGHSSDEDSLRKRQKTKKSRSSTERSKDRKKSDRRGRSRSRSRGRSRSKSRGRSRSISRNRSRSKSRGRSEEKRSRRDRRYDRDYDRDGKPQRYWEPKKDSQNEPVNDNYPLGDRYYVQDKSDVKQEQPQRKSKTTDMLNTKTGGAYIPPARLRMMQAQITDKSSAAYQRIAWEALKKSIHGHINKINVGNIGIIIKQLLRENIVRGRGLLCRSVIQAQAASPTFTNVYAALVSAINSRFPNVGELLLKRLVIQFKRGFKRNDKPLCISSASFIAHLVNQRVAHEILALELLTLLVETPTDDSVEVSIAFLKESGQKLTEVSSKGVNAIFEMLRNILHEGKLDKRVQYMIEVMFQVWKDGFKDHPAVLPELELVPEEEQFTHLMMLDEATDSQDILNVFKFDDKYEENEQKYKTLCKEILGSDAESGDEEEGSGSGSGSEEEESDDGDKPQNVTIIDNTETNLIALRRTIYLTINSSLDFEECAHKLMKMQLKPGQEIELCHMFLDCCAEQRTYEKFYGLLSQRFCQINRIYVGPFEEIFKDSYATAHRLDTNRLRNVSKFFAHLFFTDSISWEVLDCVRLNEEDTTSSSRIYIKILFQELAEYMGLKKLNDRLKDPTLQSAFAGIFPRDNPKNTRFSINFFTSIGLGGLTDELREHLKQLPKAVPQALTAINVSESSSSSSSSDSSSSSSSSDSSSDSSESDSEEEQEKSKRNKTKNKKKTKSPEKLNNPEKEKERNNPEKEKERWGHDGFYETYGDFVAPPNRQDRRDNREDRDKSYRRDRDTDRERRRDDGRNRNDDRHERSRHDDRIQRDRDDSRKDRRDRSDKDEDSSRKDRRDRDRSMEIRDDRSVRDRIEEDKESSKKDRRERDKDRDHIEKDVSRTEKQQRDKETKDKESSRKDRREKDNDRDDIEKDVSRTEKQQRDTENKESSKKDRREREKDRDDTEKDVSRSEKQQRDKETKDKESSKKDRREREKDRDDIEKDISRTEKQQRDKENKDKESSKKDPREREKNRDDIEKDVSRTEKQQRDKENSERDDKDRDKSRKDRNPSDKDKDSSKKSEKEDPSSKNRRKDDECDIRKESSIRRDAQVNGGGIVRREGKEKSKKNREDDSDTGRERREDSRRKEDDRKRR